VLYTDTRSDVSVYSDNEGLDSNSDVPTTSSHTKIAIFCLFLASDSEKVTEEKERSEPENSDDKGSDVRCQPDKSQAVSLSLEPQI
jgi:hypothetical protein